MVKTGFLRVNSISFDGDGAFSKTLKHKACGKLNIVNARFWAFRDVYGIAVSLAGIIADDNEFGEAKQQAMLAALDCVWEIGPEAFGNPEFEYSVNGKGLARLSDSSNPATLHRTE